MQTGLTTTTRSREPSRKPGDRSIGTTAASGPPNRKRRKPLSISALQGQTESGRAYHKELGCVCFENHEMGLYFINDPDDYWIEVLPLNH